ncbi:MAG: aspartyl protease family protein [Alphaproteobacteria bacterium]|nr:aspartyl protease family protein [Alphaproteobacteria bacterium]MBV9370288.1 aspartyl protease family protein [Alphaproteobacteria bacterium]MBV9899773.1 aspartyl protease family protein [Alphaproteobacteria bacterium]
MKRALALLAPLLLAAAPAHRIELTNDRLFLPVEVDGVTVPGLLDSAAEVSAVDDGLARRLALRLEGGDEVKGTGGTARVRFAGGVTLAAAGLRLAPATVAVLDLDEVVGRLVHRPTEVILGRELFDAGRLRIDISGGRIAAVPPGRAPRGVRLPLVTRKGVETFPVVVEGHPPVWADFDLGNGSEVLVGRAYAERIGLAAPGRIRGRKAGGGIGGAVERDLVVLETLRVAGRTFHDVPAAIDPLPNAADLNVGTAILKHFAITTDFPQHRLWLEALR